ncbi:hypothetical protein J7384_08385 [Endozoicomonas sp. G2_1]|uniref:ion channel n=1 Tax=Endozoicomonas sp. G2_1 TaxID=2821091 RepID=UPI001ADCED4A|nr:ion channel [Endozoicomonas sp. G2_1]MBO9490376.1 hypothetical protein [Endozoicomonas sp. G2_1]
MNQYHLWRERYGYWGLLISMTLAFVATPFFPATLQPMNIFVISSLIMSFIILSDTKAHLISSILLMVPVVLSLLSYDQKQELKELLFFFAITGGFLLLLIVSMTREIFAKKSVDNNTLISAICIYFALAMFWAMLYGITAIFIPEAFNFDVETHPQQRISELMYFSMVTLTTLGYGDLTPIAPQARSIAAMEAVVGQLYLTVLVARLVGLHINDNQSR